MYYGWSKEFLDRGREHRAPTTEPARSARLRSTSSHAADAPRRMPKPSPTMSIRIINSGSIDEPPDVAMMSARCARTSEVDEPVLRNKSLSGRAAPD